MIFTIHNFNFEIIFNQPIDIPEHLFVFLSNNKPDYSYMIDVVDHITIPDNIQIRNQTLAINTDNGYETRYMFMPGNPICYGKSIETSNNTTSIQVSKDFLDLFYIDSMFVSLLSLERRMYAYNAFILHSSYVVCDDLCILFTAPSGTGKSTQASLWEKYRNAYSVNGDRTLLTYEEGLLYANGWPICGSSNICHNQKHKINAIIVLSQAKENKVERMKYTNAYKKIISEITINYHNNDYVNKAMDFIDIIINTVPIYHLACDISIEAIKCLEEVLYEKK